MTPDPVRLLILSNSLNIGGAQRFTGTLLKGLDRTRVRPELALLRDDIGYPLAAEIPVHPLDYDGAATLPRTIGKLCRLIRQTRPQVILGTGTAVNVVIGPALLALAHRPAWIARVDIHRQDLRLRKQILSRLYPMADAIVANSAGMRLALQSYYPRVKDKVALIHNPVDFEAVDQWARQGAAPIRTDRDLLLITVGRAYPAKRWDILLDAVARVLETTPVRLVCCGDGPLLHQFKAKARRMNIHDRVDFPGHCANPFSLLAQADLFVLSSDAEGLPNALIEAQGLGLCAVSTRCDFGPDEIIDNGRTGLLVDTADAGQMAWAIQTLADNPALRQEMGARARALVRQRFDFQVRCRQWEDLIVSFAAIS
jgi:glycosyltransferase involved in cell wall biosynthesis